MRDLVERLRKWVVAVDAVPASDLMDEAASEIERLRLTHAERDGSAGSVAGEPAAWGVLRVGGSWVSILANEVQAETSRKSFDKMENWVHQVVPLYRQPTGRAVRLPQTPDDFEISEANGYAAAIVDFKRALTEAGIEWTE